MQHLSDGGFGRLFRSHRHLALGWLLLAASFEAVHAQSSDLFFEGVLLVEPAPAAGGRAQTIHLPEDSGIAGNSHLMMQDRNNTKIGGMILEWLRAEFGGSG